MREKNVNAEKTVSKLMEEFEVIRKAKGMSHTKLAKLTGLHRTTIGLLEKKKRVPTILTCLKITSALEVKLENLIKLAAERANK